MHELMGAADVIVSRAGATTIAELSALKKAVILVPFERLPGAHQLKNAEKLRELGAVVMVPDAAMQKDPKELLEAVRHLVRAPKEREQLAEKLHAEAKPNAAGELADVLVEVSEHREEHLARMNEEARQRKTERKAEKKQQKADRKALKTEQKQKRKQEKAKKRAKKAKD